MDILQMMSKRPQKCAVMRDFGIMMQKWDVLNDMRDTENL